MLHVQNNFNHVYVYKYSRRSCWPWSLSYVPLKKQPSILLGLSKEGYLTDDRCHINTHILLLQAKGHWEIIPHVHAEISHPLWDLSKQNRHTEIRDPALSLGSSLLTTDSFNKPAIRGFWGEITFCLFFSPEDQTFWLHKAPKYWVNMQLKVKRKGSRWKWACLLWCRSFSLIKASTRASAPVTLCQTENKYLAKNVSSLWRTWLGYKSIFTLEKLRRVIILVQ